MKIIPFDFSATNLKNVDNEDDATLGITQMAKLGFLKIWNRYVCKSVAFSDFRWFEYFLQTRFKCCLLDANVCFNVLKSTSFIFWPFHFIKNWVRWKFWQFFLQMFIFDSGKGKEFIEKDFRYEESFHNKPLTKVLFRKFQQPFFGKNYIKFLLWCL